MVYNMSAVEVCTTLLCTVKEINLLSDGIIINGGLLVFALILFFLLLTRNPLPESIVATSGATTVIALLFLAGGMLSKEWLLVYTLVFAMSAIGVYLRNKTT